MTRGKTAQQRFGKAFFLSVLLGLCLFTRAQQPVTIKGKTTDDKGKELPGVSIAVKGMTAGATSDNKGSSRSACRPHPPPWSSATSATSPRKSPSATPPTSDPLEHLCIQHACFFHAALCQWERGRLQGASQRPLSFSHPADRNRSVRRVDHAKSRILASQTIIMSVSMTQQTKKVRILVVGCGNMGASHATAYHELDGFEIVGLVSTGNSKVVLNEALGGHYALFNDFEEALTTTRPDAVCISTYPDTHERFAIAAFDQGCHVFIEKPLADTVEGATRVAQAATRAGKKLMVGYILRHHPSWQRFIEMSRELGTPLVMRMNLNQQSQGRMWTVHRNLMKSLSPIVDCGVHYIDVMCQMTRSRPTQVSAIGARLTEEIPAGNYNYGQLQIRFENGSVGWYEAGWGPMISETAFFVKDVIGPKGSLSIVAKDAGASGKSDSVEAHTKTESLRFHRADMDAKDQFTTPDTWINLEDEPGHQELCNREQIFFLKAIHEDLDLTDATQDAIASLRIAFACDESVHTGQIVLLDKDPDPL